MIITENKTINGKEFVYNYSNEGYYIRKIGTNETYESAYDLPDMGYSYVETADKISQEYDEMFPAEEENKEDGEAPQEEETDDRADT